MNVQFSLPSAVTPAPKPDNNPQPAAGLQELSSMISSSNGVKDLNSLEQRGILSPSAAEEQLIRQIQKAVRSLQGPETTLDIRIHEKTHELMVKVLDKSTGEVIREVPKEKTLDLVAKMMEIAGILVDERA